MTEPFQLGSVPTLSRSTVDRQETLRANADRLRERWDAARVVVLDERGRTPVSEGDAATLAVRAARQFGDAPGEEAMFLGSWHDTDYWSVPSSPDAAGEKVRISGSWGIPEEIPAIAGELWVELRGYGDALDDISADLYSTALALRNWHRRAQFCARCGGHTHSEQFGWARTCESCGREEYPRTDPAVICLVHDDRGVNGEHVLLARQPVWPEGRYSVLAGFVEAGESLEGCVIREISEEVGVAVREPRYLGSQPWPFPRSIMLGFTAKADAGAPLRPADGEIEEALWVSRDEVNAALASAEVGPDGQGSPIGGDTGRLLLPGNSSIARVMLEAWAAAG